MTFLEDFIESTRSLPAELVNGYSIIGRLDDDVRDVQKQMHGSCTQGVEDVKQCLRTGGDTEALVTRYVNSINSLHKLCREAADEKYSLAHASYDMVDSYIQRLDKYLKKHSEQAAKDAQAEELQVEAGGAGEDERQNGSNDLDIPVDPNEPTYCYCEQVSFGEMIACDNPDCKIEWFHYDCVGIRERPKGKWYCSECSSHIKRRRVR